MKIKFPQNGFNYYGDLVRYNKFYIYEGKGRIEIFVFLYMLVSLPLDFMGRIIKVFLMGQYLLIKYRINAEFKYSCANINQWILQKTYPIGFINKAYQTLSGWIYSYATKELGAQQQQPAPAQNWSAWSFVTYTIHFNSWFIFKIKSF